MTDAHHLWRAGSADLAHDATAMPEGREAALTAYLGKLACWAGSDCSEDYGAAKLVFDIVP